MSDLAWAGRKLHFIGIGGAGMSGLAFVARALGAEVSGSDQADSSYCRRLRAAGIEVALGHDRSNLPADAEVVFSSAIAPENPELAGARARAAIIHHRGDLLAEVSRLKRCLAVAGTHGKTTTASMAAHVLVRAGRRPAYLIGAELPPSGANAAWDDGDWLIVEADESDRSFLKLARDIAVVTNVELDHHATYSSLFELEQAFAEFLAPASTRVVATDVALAGERVSFGIGGGDLAATDVQLHASGSRFTIAGVPVELAVPGRHNVLNALAALGAARAAGVGIGEGAAALAGFKAAARRFDWRGNTASGARVFDDYAHHPTELRATLEAARTCDGERLVACFQPHLYSRTGRLARELGSALSLADLVIVLDVYPAREQAHDFPGVSGWLVAAAAADAARGRPVYWLPRIEDAESFLRAELGAGDLLLTLGAGDINGLAERLVEERSGAAIEEQPGAPR